MLCKDLRNQLKECTLAWRFYLSHYETGIHGFLELFRTQTYEINHEWSMKR